MARQFKDVCYTCGKESCLRHSASYTVDMDNPFAVEIERMKQEHRALMRWLWRRIAWGVPVFALAAYCMARL